MNTQISKTIALIKKSYDQPIIFHILHNHLALQVSKTNANYEITDDWSKILIYSSSKSKVITQGLESKMQSFIKRIRPPFDCNDSKLKLMCICYYLLNKPSNHILIFELVSKFLGISDYFDGLILTILSRNVVSKIYQMKEDKKISEQSTNRMLEIIKSSELSEQNKVKALVCFVNSPLRPFNLDFLDVKNDYFGYKCLEYICLYAKYAVNTCFIREIVPDHPDFICSLGSYMNGCFEFDCKGSDIDMKKALVEDKSIYIKIREAFEKAEDKKRFISDIYDFLQSLQM
jgi:hypothetical protein